MHGADVSWKRILFSVDVMYRVTWLVHWPCRMLWSYFHWHTSHIVSSCTNPPPNIWTCKNFRMVWNVFYHCTIFSRILSMLQLYFYLPPVFLSPIPFSSVTDHFLSLGVRLVVCNEKGEKEERVLSLNKTLQKHMDVNPPNQNESLASCPVVIYLIS